MAGLPGNPAWGQNGRVLRRRTLSPSASEVAERKGLDAFRAHVYYVSPAPPSLLSLMLILELPQQKHRNAYQQMVAQWRLAETPASPGKLFAGKDFDEFLALVQQDLRESDPAKVPAHLFFLADSDSGQLYGAIQIRHHIDHPNLIETGGHIGYGICPDARRQGYATSMLALALAEAKTLGLTELLLTCKDTNVASRKVIEANGGVFERTAFDDGELARRYWITID